MAGKIVADTLEHSTAGSIATNYVVEGSLKAWISIDDTNPPTKRNSGVGDSLNISSIGDGGALQFELNFTNSFSNDATAQAGYAGNRDGITTGARSIVNDGTQSTSTKHFRIVDGGSDEDVTFMMAGDLA